MKSVLVTGAAGTVGRAVVRHLRSKGWNVLPVFRKVSSCGIEGGIAVDLSQSGVKFSRLLRNRLDAIVHLAAEVPHTGSDNHSMAERTRKMDTQVISMAYERGIPLIYASGLSLYKGRSLRPNLETDPVYPSGFYSFAKAEGEKLALKQKSACIMRLGGPVGPGPSGSVLRRFFDQTMAGEAITLWGKGTREQDFVDVRDIASFVELALNKKAKGVFNVSSNKPITMFELANMIIDVLGRGTVMHVNREDPQEGLKSRYSIAKAATLGWRTHYTLRESIEYLFKSEGEEKNKQYDHETPYIV